MLKENVQGIYKIFCTGNGRVYIGQSVDTKKRLSEHRRNLEKGIHSNTILQHTYNKYRDKAFFVEVLEEVFDTNLLTERENYWAKYYNAFDEKMGFNICPIRPREYDSKVHAEKVMGMKNGNCKITDKQVVEICKLINEGRDLNLIADIYSVSRNAIRSIKIGRTRRNISEKYLKLG